MLRPADLVRVTYHEQLLHIITVRAERADPQDIITAAEVGEASIPFFLGRGNPSTVFAPHKLVDLVAANEGGHFHQVAVQLCATLGLSLHNRAHSASLAAALRARRRRTGDTLWVVILPVQAIDYQRLAAFADPRPALPCAG